MPPLEKSSASFYTNSGNFEAYKEYFNELSTGGNWNINMAGAHDSFRFLPTAGSFAKQNLIYPESIVLNLSTPAGFFMKRKDYQSYQIQYTTSGHGKLVYAQIEYDLYPGDCYFIDCFEEHHFYTVGQSPWVHHGVQLNGHQLAALFSEFKSGGTIKVSFGISDEITSLFAAVADASRSQLASSDLILNQLLLSLITKILLYNKTTSEDQLSKHIAAACDFITQNYNSIQCLDDIADACYISKYYLCREFRKETNRTVMEYLTSVRINAAKQLLSTTDLTITDVAQQIGFNSPNYFHQVFHQCEGVTPLRFRQQFSSRRLI